MTAPSLEGTAQALVAAGKGILAADESVSTIGRRCGAVGIPSTRETRRADREMLFTTPGLSAFVSGGIMYDETIRQAGGAGPLPEVLIRAGIIPGLKVDTGAKPLAACPGETATEGLDGLRDRLKDYQVLGARFAKWAGRDPSGRRSPRRHLPGGECARPRPLCGTLPGTRAGSDRGARGPHGRGA